MRDGNVPRFFCAAKRGGRTQLVGQLAGPACDPAKQDQLFQLFMILLAREEETEGMDGREDGRVGRNGTEESGRDGRRWKIIG